MTVALFILRRRPRRSTPCHDSLLLPITYQTYNHDIQLLAQYALLASVFKESIFVRCDSDDDRGGILVESWLGGSQYHNEGPSVKI